MDYAPLLFPVSQTQTPLQPSAADAVTPAPLSATQKSSLLLLLRTSHLHKVHGLDANLYLLEAFNTVLSYVIHYCGNVLREDELQCWEAIVALGYSGAREFSQPASPSQSLLLRLYTRRSRYHSVNMLRQDFCGGASMGGDGDDVEEEVPGAGGEEAADGAFQPIDKPSGIFIDVVSAVEHIMRAQQPTNEGHLPHQLIAQLDGTMLLAEAKRVFISVNHKFEAKERAIVATNVSSPTASADKKKRDYNITNKSYAADEAANLRFDQQREKTNCLKILIGHRSVSSANDLKELCRSIHTQMGEGMASERARPAGKKSKTAGAKRERDSDALVKDEGPAPKPAATTFSAPLATLFGTKERCLAYLCQHIDRSMAEDSEVGNAFDKVFSATWDLLIGKVVALTAPTKHHLTTLYQLFDLVNRFDPRRALDQHVLSAHSNSTSAHSGGHSAGTPGARVNQMSLTVGVGAAGKAQLQSPNEQSARSALLHDGQPLTVGEGHAGILFNGARPALLMPDPKQGVRCYFACQGPLLADVLCPRGNEYYDRAFDASGAGITSAVMMGKIGAIPCPMRDTMPKKAILHAAAGAIKPQSKGCAALKPTATRSVLEHSHSTMLFPPTASDKLPIVAEAEPAPYRLPNFYIFSCRDALDLYLEGGKVLNELVAVVCMGAGSGGAFGRNMVSDGAKKATGAAGNRQSGQQQPNAATGDAWMSVKRDKHGYVLPMHQRVLIGMREAVRLQRLHQLWWWARRINKKEAEEPVDHSPAVVKAEVEVPEFLTRRPVVLSPPAASKCHPLGSLQAMCIDQSRPLLEDLVMSLGPCDASSEGTLLPLSPLYVWSRCVEFLFPLLEGVHEHFKANEWLARLLTEVPLFEIRLPHLKKVVAPLCVDINALDKEMQHEGQPSVWHSPSIPSYLLAESLAPISVAHYISHSMPQSLGPYPPSVPLPAHLKHEDGPLSLSLLQVPYRYHKRGHWWFRLSLNTANHLSATSDPDGQAAARWSNDKADTPAVKLKKAENTERALSMVEGLFHDLADWRMLEESGVRAKVAQHQQLSNNHNWTRLTDTQGQWAKQMLGGHVTALSAFPEAIYFPSVSTASDFPFTAAQRTTIATLERFVFHEDQPAASSTSVAALTSTSSASTAKAANNVLWSRRQYHFIRRADLIECERIYIKLFTKPRRWGEPSSKLLSLHLREPGAMFVRGRRHEGGGWLRNDLMLTYRTNTTSEFISATQTQVSLTTKTVLNATKVNAPSVNVEEVAAQWYRSGCGKRPALQPVRGLSSSSLKTPGSQGAGCEEQVLAYGTASLRSMMASNTPPQLPSEATPNAFPSHAAHFHLGVPWVVGHMEGWWIEQTCQCIIKGYTQSPNSCRVVTEIVRVPGSGLEVRGHPLYIRVIRYDGRPGGEVVLTNIPPTEGMATHPVVARALSTALPYEWLGLYQSSPSSAHHHHTLLTYLQPHLDLLLRYVEYLGTGLVLPLGGADASAGLLLSTPYSINPSTPHTSIKEPIVTLIDDLSLPDLSQEQLGSHHRGLRRAAFMQLMCCGAGHIKGHEAKDYRQLFLDSPRLEQDEVIVVDPSVPEVDDAASPSKRLFQPPPPLTAAEIIEQPILAPAALALNMALGDEDEDDDNANDLLVFRQQMRTAATIGSPADSEGASAGISPTNPASPQPFPAQGQDKLPLPSTPFDSFEKLMAAMPILPLARLLRVMLLSPPVNGYGMKFNGFPDLVCWHSPNPCFGIEKDDSNSPGTSPTRKGPALVLPTKQPFAAHHGTLVPLYIEPLFLLSEVKSPTDSLSEKQLTVNDALLRCGFLVHVLHVVDAGKEDQDAFSTTATVSAQGQQLARISSGGNKTVLGSGSPTSKKLAAPRRTVPVLKAHGSATNPMWLDE